MSNTERSGTTRGGPAGSGRAATPTKRQYVRFAFYTMEPAWRGLDAQQQTLHKQELAQTIRTFDRRMLLRPYSLMGTRADAELLLWQIAESIEPFQELSAAIARTSMSAYLRLSASYLSQTKRSIYEIRDQPGEDEERLVISPSEARYLFVYPFLKTRPWYKLTLEERQRMMDEHIRVGRKYPSVKLNTTYSFGLDDQEFVVAFETDEPADFLDLVQDLRETDASLYTLRDTPLYTCVNMGLEESLDAMGGPRIAPKRVQAAPADVWAAACPLAELPEGGRKLIYVNGKQVALFNQKGAIYAIDNRCSHARGPLVEGQVDADACSVTCPWHYAKFDLKTGQVIDGVASQALASYDLDIREGMVWIGPAKSVTASEVRNV
jgi:chlorite dismutase/nitrite reductase/ring-hydroxylating ferredoxin subunit